MRTLNKEKIVPWLRRRGYRHFDEVNAGRQAATALDPRRVATHSFFPFLGTEKVTRRFRRASEPRTKRRSLRYAAHFDARIYAYYSTILSDLLEKRLADLQIASNVTAYRKLEGNLCNIHLAQEAFEWIKRNGDCDAIGADVRDFFESLDHQRLKQQWCSLLNVELLPPDHFAVYRNITRYSWVDLKVIQRELKVSSSSLDRNSVPGKQALPLANIADLRRLLKRPGVVQRNNGSNGIPQGSPMSAVLSNMYMTDADLELSRYADLMGGIYRRYSDDILLVVGAGGLDEAKAKLVRVLSEHGLENNERKLIFSQFRSHQGMLKTDQPLQYLGFEFDGQHILIRKRSLSVFQQRMCRAVKRSLKSAIKHQATQVNRQSLYERYSHLGKRNFVTYAKRASIILYGTLKSPIMRQLRHSWTMLQLRIENADQQLRSQQPDDSLDA